MSEALGELAGEAMGELGRPRGQCLPQLERPLTSPATAGISTFVAAEHVSRSPGLDTPTVWSESPPTTSTPPSLYAYLSSLSIDASAVLLFWLGFEEPRRAFE